jgi:hypothetical protein
VNDELMHSGGDDKMSHGAIENASHAITAKDGQDQIGSEIGRKFCKGDLNIRVKWGVSPSLSKWIANEDLPGLKKGRAGFFREDSKVK